MQWLTLALFLALGACSSTNLEPTQAEMKANWEEQNIPPQNYKADIIAFMRTYLNNPTAVRGASLSAPERKTPIGYPAERYVACVRYDAKKTSGDYAGMKTGAAVFLSGKLDRFLDTPRETREVCKDVEYQPFPELSQLKR